MNKNGLNNKWKIVIKRNISFNSFNLLSEFRGSLHIDAAPLFETNCAGCHINGSNIIRGGKNLKQRALKRNGYEDVDEIATLIINGKGNMSAYGDKLSPEEINALAQYVLDWAAVN